MSENINNSPIDYVQLYYVKRATHRTFEYLKRRNNTRYRWCSPFFRDSLPLGTRKLLIHTNYMKLLWISRDYSPKNMIFEYILNIIDDLNKSLQLLTGDKSNRDDPYCSVLSRVFIRPWCNRVISRRRCYCKIYHQCNARSIPTFEAISTIMHRIWQDFRIHDLCAKREKNVQNFQQ